MAKYPMCVNSTSLTRGEIRGAVASAIREYGESLGVRGLSNFFLHGGGNPYGDCQVMAAGVLLVHKGEITEKDFREALAPERLVGSLSGDQRWTVDQLVAISHEALNLVIGKREAVTPPQADNAPTMGIQVEVEEKSEEKAVQD